MMPKTLPDELAETADRVEVSTSQLLVIAEVFSLLQGWRAVQEKASGFKHPSLGAHRSPSLATGEAGAPCGPYEAILVGPVSPPENATTSEGLPELPVLDKAACNCSLWIHTDGARLIEAYCLVEAWGFEPRALLTLVWGDGLQDGPFVENTTYVLLAVRGEPQLRETNQGTLVVVDGGEAYEQLLEVIETVCEGGKLLFNCEVGHPGWDDWPKFEYETH